MENRREDREGEGAAADREAPPTTDQLRDDIDSGRTRDKVAKSDPAAAPLGSDAEAAGAPPTPEEVDTARRGETARGAAERPSDSQVAPQTARRPSMMMVGAIVAAVLVAIILAVLF